MPNSTSETGMTIRARSDQPGSIFSVLRNALTMNHRPNSASMPPSTEGKYPGPIRSEVPNG